MATLALLLIIVPMLMLRALAIAPSVLPHAVPASAFAVPELLPPVFADTLMALPFETLFADAFTGILIKLLLWVPADARPLPVTSRVGILRATELVASVPVIVIPGLDVVNVSVRIGKCSD